MDTRDLRFLLDELRRAGEKPKRSLLDRVKSQGSAAVPSLIEMATDESLNHAPTDSPEVWAPLHAVQLLGELGAPEAVAPLLALLGQEDDDYLSEAIPEALGRIGVPALEPARALLFGLGRYVWARVWAAECLSRIGQRLPEVRDVVVNALIARLDPTESRTPDDEILNGSVISALIDLKAVEAAPAIRRAFAEDRVDTSIVDLRHALESLDLPSDLPVSREESPGLRLRLRCKGCGYEREHRVETIYLDLGTQERRARGESTPYSEWVIPQRITCSKCGAVDQYELTSMAYLALTAEMLKKTAAGKAGLEDAESDEGPLRAVRLGLDDGREMHPFEALDYYRERVAAAPENVDLRERYGSVFRFLGYREEAIEQYRKALLLQPANLEAGLSLGRLFIAVGDLPEARRMFKMVIAQASNSGLPRQTQREYLLEAAGELFSMDEKLGLRPGEPPALGTGVRERVAPPVARPSPTATPAPQKVGRNDPCPCGSGRKYKKCHGR
jgi:tetratricopeptide (TPR) repeat protein